MRDSRFILISALVAAAVLSGCLPEQQGTQSSTTRKSSPSADRVAEVTLPSGTSIDVTLGTPLTSETAHVGDSWTGSAHSALLLAGRNVISAGTPVSGTVTSVTPAHQGNRALLGLGLTAFTVDGRSYPVHATTQDVIAGSPRSRNLGAIAGGAAAGALVGQAASHSKRGTTLGGLIGAGAAAGIVSQSRGWQVVLAAGTPLTFTTNESVAVRL